jgi:hypothetical protein
MATVSKGRTFTSGETVTPAKLNDVVDLATVTEIVNADIKSDAAIALSKLATGALPTAITVATANLVDANVTPVKLSQPLTLETAKATTSGNLVDFTGIPSWVKKITFMLNGVSTTGTGNLLFRLGDSNGIVTSGYECATATIRNNETATSAAASTGFRLTLNNVSTAIERGLGTVVNFGGNTWVMSYIGHRQTGNTSYASAVLSLGGALTQVGLSTSDTFSAGQINIMYEG